MPPCLAATRAYSRRFSAEVRSWCVGEKLSFKLRPCINELVSLDDFLKTCRVDCALFDELKQARLVLRAAGFERDCSEMFGGEDSCRHALHIDFPRLLERLFDER